MRIGIDVDILGLPNPYTGIPNYLRHLVNALIEIEAEAECFYLISRKKLYGSSVLPTNFKQTVVRCPFSHGWQSVILPWATFKNRLDLLHMPAFSMPAISYCPVVVTIHDLAYLTHPGCCPTDTVKYLSQRVPKTLRKASAVITPSAFVKEEIIRYFGFPDRRIYPVLHGVNKKFKVLPNEDLIKVRQELGLPEHFFLFVGTIEPRKNLMALIEAFGQVTAQGLDYSLVLAGTKGWKCEDIYALPLRLGLENRVRFLDYVPDNLLPALYNAASIFVFPSLYEGFGLPVLEAMACGTPVICSKTTSLPEVVGGAGILVDPLDVRDLASAMLLLAHEVNLRKEMTQKGLDRAARFNWATTARETKKVYEACVNAS